MISVENTSTPGNGHFPLGIFPYDIFLTLACDGILQEVQVLR